MKRVKIAAAAVMLVLAPAGMIPAGLAQGSNGNWNLTVEEGEVSHRIGNPDAKIVLTEYVSYTCGTCARFAREGDPNLELAYIGPGDVAVEIRHLLRDPVDLTIAMMTKCGASSKFKQNHAAFMLTRDKWFARVARSTDADRSRWSRGGAASRRDIANDLKLYDIMEQRGYRVTDVDRCINDEALANALAVARQGYVEKYGNHGTPMFTINGVRVEVSPVWSALKPEIDAALSQK